MQIKKNGQPTGWTQHDIYQGNPGLLGKFQVDVDDLGGTSKVGLNKVVNALKNATADDHVVVMTHSYADIDEDTKRVTERGLYIGTEKVKIADIVAQLKLVGTTKAQSMSFMACSLTAEEAESLRAAAGVPKLYYSDVRQGLSYMALGQALTTNRTLKDKKVDEKKQVITATWDSGLAADYDPTKHVTWIDDTNTAQTMKVVEAKKGTPPK